MPNSYYIVLVMALVNVAYRVEIIHKTSLNNYKRIAQMQILWKSWDIEQQTV